jgi:hypothetical protein
VKVGRPALDEDAIRWIEEHNPDIEFNWPKILEAQPPPAAPAEESRGRRPRKEGRDKRRQPQQPQQQQPQPHQHQAPRRPSPAPVQAEPAPPQEQPEAPEVAEALEQITHPDTEESVLPPPSAPDAVIDKELLTRLRARFAELQARITERGGDAARIDELKAQAEPLNPDAWVTEEEVRKGVEEFEPRIRALRAALGLRRRRRSRRGGRRRHRGRQAGQTGTAPPASDQTPDASGADEDDDDHGDDDGADEAGGA